ncbi:DDT domain-containing protein [Tanacetum coccineum]|uniref:DDT domain-containing protein n=1 Tax=Tanacetum coccineum TaxID=301880 RepID=A0ABQ5AKD5_9ASTR
MSKKKQPQRNNRKSKYVAAKSNVFKKPNSNKKVNSKLGLRNIQDDLLSADYIITKVLRKDGPPLGVEFDTLPGHAFRFCNQKDSKKSHRVCQEKQRAFKRQKTFKPTIVDDQITPRDSDLVKHGVGKGLMAVRRLASQPARSHGMGKGFMAIQRLTQLGGVNLPTCTENDHGVCSQPPLSTSKKPTTQGKKNPRRKQPVKRRVVNKVPEKKSSTRSKKVRCEQVDAEKQRRSGVCEIALVDGRIEEDPSQYAMLVDDEELELRELQETSNHATSCAHCAANKLHECSLYKDLLAEFPPSSVRMKQPLHMQPWDSSPQLCKKLFKIFHFISTYVVIICTQPFTFDELAQAFIDKDSLLLGKLNISLLELLLTGVEKELDIEYVSHISKNWKYRALIQSIEREDSLLKFWKKSLNPLTWIEILRQVLVAAGFGSKRDMSLKEPPSKEAALMARYGLRPGTLKGELFTILLLQGNGGMKISELATSSSIVGLRLATTTDKVEELISSMLSSDITLFEKISSSSYRLRSNAIIKDAEDDQSDLEDYGSVDDDPNDTSNSHNIDDLDDCSGALVAHKHGQTNSTIHSEIDESHPGEMWLLGLIEGEYSDLNIDEKLNALLALVDLLKAGSSIQIEEPVSSSAQYVPNIYQIGFGAKIKRSTAKHQRIFVPLKNNYTQIINSHKRIYFKSSEDDHWDVIETQEALTSLLSVLDRRGRQECHLFSSLEKREAFLSEAMSSIHNDVRVGKPTISGDSERCFSRDDSSSAVSDVDNLLGLNCMHHDNLASTSDVIAPIGNREQAKQKWCERCHDLFWRDEKHCRICHTTFELDFDLEERYAIHVATCRDDSDPDMFPKHKILSSQLQSLKAAAYTLELSMPEGSMVGAWTKSVHNVWVRRLRRTSTLAEFLQVLGDFVGAINTGWSYESDTALGFDFDLDDIIASFASMPQTSSAVALWLVKLDFIVAPHLKRVDLETTTSASTRTRSKGKQTLVE